MPSSKKMLVLTLGSLLLSTQPLPGQAAESTITEQLAEARQEGSIWTAINLNRDLKPFRLSVDVEKGRALLGGKVASEEQRNLAGQVAMSIEGISAVDNQITVDPALASGEAPRSDMAQRWDDTALAARVKARLLVEKHIDGLDIKVSSKGGAVILEGTAPSEEASQQASHLAAQTEGVASVDNRLKVVADGSSGKKLEDSVSDAQAAVSDAWITSQIKADVLARHALGGLSIGVSTRDGVVSLSGVVPDDAERQQLIETARKTRGVREVDASALKVAGQAASLDRRGEHRT
ncbi:BON domain-containing protein [Pseudomonas sp. ZM23]|uniref:BON domain-containing protein n=1 Tax=Pseudomonas triclosanedens TaxID=2961893 RepID=A0ABY6ZXZ9_9PSED|nr:BON domain-containing protein [Pseudomonas triclosanedens]MCP8462470.1 BON domain-containing protein [Pseudomonas triclosanedens]MCP8468108.1 BON domain-containing protein [Pseudomonas triclosanedens]MCP8474867.1 BON domain-containing protein [Pseudomonas triclosanedens]WAI49664.1 BON domain-containing protein [Pseudomonas triclosanedens]